MNESYYNIADIIIKIISPFPFLTENGKEFVCGKQVPDYTFEFCECQDVQSILEETEFVADIRWAHEYKKKDGTWIRAFLWKEYFYPIVTILGDKKGVCYFASSNILADKAEEGFELWMYLCLERILINNDALVLHSSHININGTGLVFSAPSQTGKSTQANLWQQYASAIVMNGDRSILRKKNDSWQVYGCPMCGTSGIHKQGYERLSNIIMLSQGTNNVLSRIRGLQAFRMVYPEITISSWDKMFVNNAIRLLDELLDEVPIYSYSCTKDETAVTILKKALNL